ncbi:uncharacterized protein [Argopecten irradians]|uniref:uncharacterized protein n=1 Tax=Argopecten irradians TaxID=31199 RepID=UPI00371FD0A0
MLTYRAILTVSMVCGAVIDRADDTGVYYKHLTLPLSTFVGENKVEYGCEAFPLKADEYIAEYLPIGERDDVHHITVGMCDEPYSDAAIWECVDPNHVCKNTKRVFLYSWTNGAPGWTLPKDTGIYTGDRARHFILQVHGRDDISDECVAEFAHMRLKIRTNSGKTMMFCLCDSLCESYDDCCYNAKNFTKTSLKQAKEQLTFLEKASCEAVKYGQMDGVNKKKGIFMVSSPPKIYPSTKLDLKQKCENNMTSDDPNDFVPVTELFTGVAFKNRHCAVCNHVQDWVSWMLETHC